jgi:hypothetical protein
MNGACGAHVRNLNLLNGSAQQRFLDEQIIILFPFQNINCFDHIIKFKKYNRCIEKINYELV